MLQQTAQILQFDCFYTASKVGKTGLTVTCDVYRGGTAVVTAGTATEIGGGFYTYQLASGSNTTANNYRAVFHTTDTTVDQKDIPALYIVGETWVQNVDAAVSSRSTFAGGAVASVTADVGITQAGADKVWGSAARTLTSFGTLAADVWAAATRTLTAISDSSGVTTLLARLTAGRGTNLDNLDATVSSRSTLGGTAQTGDSFARLGAPAGASIAADIAEVEGETDSILGVIGTPVGVSLAADIGTRLPTSGYTAPPTTASILAAFQASSDWALFLANVNGHFNYTPPGALPGSGVLTLKDKANVVTLATITLTIDAQGNITSRSVV